MGSRMMHYCMTTQINKVLNIQADQLLIGGLAPDVHKQMNQPKAVSHFAKADLNGIVHTDFTAFHAKYLTGHPSPFHLGYYYHLISDDIWVKEIYYKKIKWLPPEEKKIAQTKYYRDFWRLNGKLADYYSVQPIKLEVVPVEIDEIDYRFLPALIEEMYRDFERMDEAKEEKLEILDFDEVIQILERSIHDCLRIG